MAEIIEVGSAAPRAAGGAQNTSDDDRRAATTAAAVGYGRDELAGDGDAMSGPEGGSAGNGVAATSRPEDVLVREGDLAGDYLERLLDLLDYDGDIDLDVEAGRAIVSIDGGEDLQKLVGHNGTVLEALQELTRLAVQQETGVRSRLMLDIAQWRAGRRTELAEIGRDAARRALASGNSVKLAPMTPFERKIVHDAVARVSGVHSESEGEEPRRRVVVFRTP